MLGPNARPPSCDSRTRDRRAALFLRVAQQAITKDESLDHLSYSGKIREMLAEHVRATGLSTTVRLRNITDPEFKDDFDTAEKSEEELQEAFVRKAAELKRVTRELVDKNPAQYGRFSERVLEIIRRFEEGQIASAEGAEGLRRPDRRHQCRTRRPRRTGHERACFRYPADHGAARHRR